MSNRQPDSEIHQPSSPDYARTPEQQEGFRGFVAKWLKFMDENPEAIEKLEKKDGQLGSKSFLKPIVVDLLTLEPSIAGRHEPNPKLWLIRGPEGASQIVTLEVPAAIPNPGMNPSDQEIRPGVYEYECGQDYIYKTWLSDSSVSGVAPMKVTENIPTESELEGLSWMLETAVLAQPKQTAN